MKCMFCDEEIEMGKNHKHTIGGSPQKSIHDNIVEATRTIVQGFLNYGGNTPKFSEFAIEPFAHYKVTGRIERPDYRQFELVLDNALHLVSWKIKDQP